MGLICGRFDENATLDRLADRQALSADLIAKLARHLHSHERAPRRDGEAAAQRWALSRSEREAFAARPDLFEADGKRLAADARAV